MPASLRVAPILATLAASLVCAPIALAANDGATTANATQPAMQSNGHDVSTQDTEFVRHAAQAGLSEVMQGTLAMKKSPNLAVQEFGRWMVTDHTSLNQSLEHAARADGIPVPTTVSPMQQSEYTRLEGLKGAAFDQQYINDQVAAHERAVTLFQTEASSGQNARLRHLAALGVPILKEHLAEAQELQHALPSESAQR